MKASDIANLITGMVVMVDFSGKEKKAGLIRKINLEKATVNVQIRGKFSWVGVERIEVIN